MAIVDRVSDIVEPLLPALGIELYDIDHAGGNLKITVDCDGGVTLDQLAEATRVIGRALDEADPMPGSYTLEVSSPGVERRLRTAAHFAAAVGEQVSVKLAPHVDGPRRISGTLIGADAAHVVVTDDDGVDHKIDLTDITRANTVFVWESSPRPGSAEARARAGRSSRTDTPSPETTDPERRTAAR